MIANGILFVFGVLTITFASWKDGLSVGILVSNVAIGSFEIRSKRALDHRAGSGTGARVICSERALPQPDANDTYP